MKKIFLIIITLLSICFQVSAYDNSREYIIERKYLVKNTSTSKTISFLTFVPDLTSYMNSRVLKRVTSKPVYKIRKEHNARVLMFKHTLNPGQREILKITWRVRLKPYNVFTSGIKYEMGNVDKARYLQSEKYMEADSPLIIRTAKRITRYAYNELEKIKAVFYFVKRTINYTEFPNRTYGALYALKNRIGDCSEYGLLSVALLRAIGIPARIATVLAIRKSSGRKRFDNHVIAEVYSSEYGWLPLEPFFGHKTIGRLRNYEVIMRRGWRTDNFTSWMSYRISRRLNRYKKIKMLGHTWRRIK